MSNDSQNRPPQTWAGRNAGMIFGAVCFVLLALVITAQVAC